MWLVWEKPSTLNNKQKVIKMVCEHIADDYKILQSFVEKFCHGIIVRVKCPYCETYYNVNV